MKRLPTYRRERKTLPLFSSTNGVILFPRDKVFLKKNKRLFCVGVFERACVFNAYNLYGEV